MNIVTMIAEVDPHTIDHVVNLIKQGYTSGELHISLANSEETVNGWWHKVEDASITFKVADAARLIDAWLLNQH